MKFHTGIESRKERKEYLREEDLKEDDVKAIAARVLRSWIPLKNVDRVSLFSRREGYQVTLDTSMRFFCFCSNFLSYHRELLYVSCSKQQDKDNGSKDRMLQGVKIHGKNFHGKFMYDNS